MYTVQRLLPQPKVNYILTLVTLSLLHLRGVTN